MTTVALERPSFVGRIWGGVLALWGGFIGLVPHVLHHVGPLAGAALLAGVTGRVLFAAMFSLSSLVIGPAISGDDAPSRPGIQDDGHAQHH